MKERKKGGNKEWKRKRKMKETKDPLLKFYILFHMWKNMGLKHFHKSNYDFKNEMKAFSDMKYLIHIWSELAQNLVCEIWWTKNGFHKGSKTLKYDKQFRILNSNFTRVKCKQQIQYLNIWNTIFIFEIVGESFIRERKEKVKV